MELEKINQSKIIKITTNIGVALIVLFILASFNKYYSLKLNLINPLIPEDLVLMSARSFLVKGVILLIGLFGILVLKSFKKNMYACGLVILIICYYIFSNHYIGGWNTVIN